jgi:hypothetical protein
MLGQLAQSWAAAWQVASPEAITSAFTVVLAVSTILLWLETRRLATLASAQGADLRRSVEVAERSSLAALKQAEISERTLFGLERPLLHLNIIEWGPPLPLQPSTAVYRPYVELRITNFGRLSAILSELVVEFCAVERERSQELPIPLPGSIDWSPTQDFPLDEPSVLAVGESINVRCNGYIDVTPGKLEPMWGIATRRIVLIGTLHYADAVGIQREKGFAYHFSPLGGLKGEVGHGEWATVPRDGYQFDRVVGGLDKT